MSQFVDNAIIMAAGFSSRFTASSNGKLKALVTVRGEVLIERQIRQLLEAGVPEIYIVLGHNAEAYQYLAELFPVKFLYNSDYRERNNHSSIYAARDVIRNSYICSVDNYFSQNPFESVVQQSYYAAVYATGETKEWCIEADEENMIRAVTIGGRDSWYMLGHAYWDASFSSRFIEILTAIYEQEETKPLYWEDIYIQNLASLPMELRKYPEHVIQEFDTVDELLSYDPNAII